jgi:hypothetical protein
VTAIRTSDRAAVSARRDRGGRCALTHAACRSPGPGQEVLLKLEQIGSSGTCSRARQRTSAPRITAPMTRAAREPVLERTGAAAEQRCQGGAKDRRPCTPEMGWAKARAQATAHKLLVAQRGESLTALSPGAPPGSPRCPRPAEPRIVAGMLS